MQLTSVTNLVTGSSVHACAASGATCVSDPFRTRVSSIEEDCIPVLPAVPSVMRPASWREPLAKASCMMLTATLSLTLPPGFKNSAFARIYCKHTANIDTTGRLQADAMRYNCSHL